ncbi:beta-lactamase/transpeptidase-like protein [Xylaria telfairii]|nr:beta-lactamase/transpeptidase-like protein [Xylaria telfairii]
MSRSTELFSAKLTVIDILSHRTGKAWADALYLQSNNRILLTKEHAIPVFDYLAQIEPPRSTYMYNNHAYNIAGLVVERVTGLTWSNFINQRIFKPLGMTRSFTYQPDDNNVAVPYNILTNREPWRLPFCNASNDTLMFAGQSIRTSIADLIQYSKAYLQALGTITPTSRASGSFQKQDMISKRARPLSWLSPSLWPVGVPKHKQGSSLDEPTSPSNPIRQISTIIRPHIARSAEAILEQTYALGWNRTQLPGCLDFGWNKQMIGSFPKLGQRYPGRLVIWHGGNMPGTTAAICLLPETGTAVVVLQNSLGLCDVADWICQLVIDTIFLGEPAQDYVSLASECARNGTRRMDAVEEKLRQEQIPGTKPRSLELYCGRYFNSIQNWFIDIKEDMERKGLYFEFLGLRDERYYLKHYHHDTFNWNLTYDELVKRGQYIRDYEYYKLAFEMGNTGEACSLRWKHDKSVPTGELFCKSWNLENRWRIH